MRDQPGSAAPRMTSKPIVTLGIHDGMVAAAAIVVDGELRAACAEERLTRKKNQAGIPLHAVETVLATEDLTINDVDQIAISTQDGIMPTVDDVPASQTTRRLYDVYGAGWSLLASIERHWPASRALTLPSDAARRLGRSVLRRARAAAVVAATGADPERMVFYDHHTAHAMALAPLIGPEPTLAFTLDGEGDGLSGAVAWYRNGQPPERLGAVSRNASLGHVYAGVTGHLRMTPHQDEFKVMGMAPYAHAGARDACYQRLRSLLRVARDRSGAPSMAASRGTRLVHRFIGDYLREFRFDAQCGAVQRLCEETILEWMSAWVQHLGLDRNGVDVGLGGGVFMNVKANMRIAQQPWARTVTPIPSCGDESCAVGAAYLGYLACVCGRRTTEPQLRQINHLYLGPGWERGRRQARRPIGLSASTAYRWSVPRRSWRIAPPPCWPTATSSRAFAGAWSGAPAPSATARSSPIPPVTTACARSTSASRAATSGCPSPPRFSTEAASTYLQIAAGRQLAPHDARL